MKKVLAAVLLSTALLVTGCGGSDEPAPRETFGQESRVSDEDKFLANVAQHMSPALANEPQEDVVELGHVICDATGDGVDPEQIALVGLRSSLPPEDIGVIIGSAVRYLCPEHRDVWTDYFNSINSSI